MELTDSLKTLLIETAKSLKGSARRSGTHRQRTGAGRATARRSRTAVGADDYS
jgi:hypothetical protein